MFDYNKDAKPGSWGGIRNNIATALNFGADIGGWIKNRFSQSGRGNYDTRYGPNAMAQGQAPAISAPAPIIPTAHAQTTQTTGTGIPSPMYSSASSNPNPSMNYGGSTGSGYMIDNSGGTPIPPKAPYQIDYSTNNIADYLANTFHPITAKDFSINPGDAIPSNSANPGTTIQDALNIRNQYATGLANGSAPWDHVPSDQMLAGTNSPLSSIVGSIYDTAQYSPQQIAAMQSGADLQSRILQTQLASRRKVQALLENGSITREQAQAFTAESQRLSDAQLADLSVSLSGNTLYQQVLGQLQQNKLGALKDVAGFYKPEAVAPGSSLMNAFGQNMGMGTGMNPSQVMSYAQQLYQQDLTTGSPKMSPTGQVDFQYYLGQAQGALQSLYGGGMGGSNVNGFGGMSGNGAGMGGSTGGMPGQFPPQLATYLQASGGQIINEDKVPKNQQDLVKQLAAQNGVPYLSGGDLDKYQSILVTKDNLNNMNQVANRILSNGLGGRTLGAAWNTISGYLQLNPDVASFKAWRDTAVNTIQALAGGQGSGFRLNQAEINLAANNLPTITDNLETASAKMSIVNSMLDRWQNQILHGNPGTNQGQGGGSIWNW